MNRETLERELRELLTEHRTHGVVSQPLGLLSAEIDALMDSLLPWIVETVEQVEAETREECGRLP